MQVDLDGRVALVTGAARGIGKAIADTLAANGAAVAYTDRDGTAAEAAAGSHLALALDVRDGAQIERAVAAVLARHGRLDILVNNAGIGTEPHQRKTIDAFDEDAWDTVIAVDLTGVFRMSKAALPPMITAGFGRIVNIASVVGLVPLRLQSAYVAAKAGVVNLTRSMALELAQHGILVNAVAPGSTATESWERWIKDASSEQASLYQRLLSHIPLGRPATTQEIANAALFLAAPETTYVTGHVLTVDGGWTAGFSRDF